jgi:hypothetical protein
VADLCRRVHRYSVFQCNLPLVGSDRSVMEARDKCAVGCCTDRAGMRPATIMFGFILTEH